jgi:hypothetical protein
MFMPVLDIPQNLRDEPTPAAAVGPVLAVILRHILDEPPPREMQELLRRVRERDESERYWMRFCRGDDAAVR